MAGPYGHWLDGCGTVFKITPEGTLTTLYSFCPKALRGRLRLLRGAGAGHRRELLRDNLGMAGPTATEARSSKLPQVAR